MSGIYFYETVGHIKDYNKVLIKEIAILRKLIENVIRCKHESDKFKLIVLIIAKVAFIYCLIANIVNSCNQLKDHLLTSGIVNKKVPLSLLMKHHLR